MLNGLLPVPSTAHLAGFPVQGAVYGYQELQSEDGLRRFGVNVVTDGVAVRPQDYKLSHYIDGVLANVSNGGVPEFATPIPSVRVVNSILSTAQTETDQFSVLFTNVPGVGLSITWTANTQPDFSYYELYWDHGQAGLTELQFYKYVTIRDQNATTLLLRDLPAGTYRFYIKAVDVYGNSGPSVPDVYSVVLTLAPVLAGTFSFTSSDNHVFVSFTPTESTGIVEIYLYANILMGIVGPLTYVNRVIPLQNGWALPEGQLRIYAIGVDADGNWSNIVEVVKRVILIDGVYYVGEDVELPTNIESVTLAAGEFRLDFESENHASWDVVEIEIYDDTNLVFSDTLVNQDAIAQSFTIDPSLTDGEYQLRLRAVKTNVFGDLMSDWSANVSILLDSTYPAGSTVLTLEQINE